MKREFWKPIWGYTGLYEISNLGRIRGIERWCRHRTGWRLVPKKVLSPTKNEWGYLIVMLSKNNKLRPFRVSRLVAKHFIANPLRLPQVNHLKGNKNDNRAWMLEWSTCSDNIKHAWRLGLNKGRLGMRKVKSI